MVIDSIETLLALLRRVELLSPAQVAEIARDVAPRYPDPQLLAGYLMEIDWLTPFQAQLLFDGRWDELAIGPYQVLAPLGEGGVSEVFQAWDTIKGRVVALKVLRQHLVSHMHAFREFQRELQTVTRLSHPNIIKTYEAHQIGAVHYFAMEYVEGMDLDRYIKKVGPLPVEQACDYVRQVALGLQHAHQMGLVHRDIKPANLFLIHPTLPGPDAPGGVPRWGPEAQVKILDWGLARVRPAPGETLPETDLDDLADEKGKLIGTADYIAPEQARDPALVDIRADIYSLGCTLYFLLTGKAPFRGLSLMMKLLQHQEADPPSVREQRPDVPEELDALVRRMMAKRPEGRFQIPLLVVGALRRFCPNLGGSGNSGVRPALVLPGPARRPGSSADLNLPATAGGGHDQPAHPG